MTPEQKMAIQGNAGMVGTNMLTSLSNLTTKIKELTKDLKDWNDYSLTMEQARKLDKYGKLLAIENKAFTEFHEGVKKAFTKEEQDHITELIGTLNQIQSECIRYIAGWQLANDQQLYD